MSLLGVGISIRYQLLMAFCAVLLLVAVLAGYGIVAVSASNELARRIYDESLVAVNQAKAAYTKFTKVRSAMESALDLAEETPRHQLRQIEDLRLEIVQDLAVVGDRISSPSLDMTLRAAERKLDQWYRQAEAFTSPPSSGLTEVPFPDAVTDQAGAVAAAIDQVVEDAAAYGFAMRVDAGAKLAQSRSNMIALALVTTAVGIIISLAFAVSISRPIRAATGVAERVATGDFSDEITSTRGDELGRLLRCLAHMQVNLREAAAADQAEMRLQYERFGAAISNMSAGLCMFDADKRLVVCNDRYIEMYGLPRKLATSGTPFADIIEHRIKHGIFAGGDPQAYVRERLDAIDEGAPSTKVHQLTNGRVVAIAHRPMANGGWVATHEDITELQRVQAQLAYMAHYDSLTDLPNRVLLRERIEQALPQAKRGESFAVLCLDLDRFKNVNDTLGHAAGDDLLRAVAERLRGCTRECDTVARLGGDEFAIVQLSDRQPEDATALAIRICDAIKKPFELQSHQVVIDSSIGIAIAPSDGFDAEHLLRKADMALYGAKSDGRGIYRFFEDEMDSRMKSRRQLELDLRKALAEGAFELNYQPLVNLQSDQISCLEALLRWRHSERGPVEPLEFIPVAEESGLIVPMGEWVLRQACADAATWPDHINVAVNLSPAQFQSDGLVPMVLNALASTGIAAGRLELEITESVLLRDNQATLKKLHQLRNLGVRIAMDDFGTGYSSLSYLRSFPFDKIKIDGSFVHHGEAHADRDAIVNAIANLGRSLGMATTAEGVETEEQLEVVRAAGCTEMQGFIFSRPCSAGEISRLFFPAAKKIARQAS